MTREQHFLKKKKQNKLANNQEVINPNERRCRRTRQRWRRDIQCEGGSARRRRGQRLCGEQRGLNSCNLRKTDKHISDASNVSSSPYVTSDGESDGAGDEGDGSEYNELNGCGEDSGIVGHEAPEEDSKAGKEDSKAGEEDSKAGEEDSMEGELWGADEEAKEHRDEAVGSEDEDDAREDEEGSEDEASSKARR